MASVDPLRVPAHAADDSVAALVLETLARAAGIRMAFGISGGPIVPLYSALAGSEMRYLQTSSEREAGYMARGHYLLHQRPAVVLATTGAQLDVLEPAVGARESREPFLILTAVTPPELSGLGCLQEVDPIGAFHAAQIPGKAVYHVDNVLFSVREALQALFWHRTPFVLAFPKEVLMAARPARSRHAGSVLLDPADAVDRAGLERFARTLVRAERPLLVLGRESVLTEADQARVCEIARRFRIPVATTQRGRGAVPEDGFKWAVGSIGSGSSPVAQFLAFEPKSPVDGLFVVGSQLRQLATNSFRDLAGGPDGLNVIADDPQVLAKYPLRHGLVARNPTVALRVLLDVCEGLDETADGASHWTTAELARLRVRLGESHDPPTSRIATFLRALSAEAGPGVMWFVGSGEHNLHFSQHVRITAPRGYNYESFGMMGADLPCAMGYTAAQAVDEPASAESPGDDARFAALPGRPQRNLVAVVTGDGCLMRSLGSLVTLAANRLPVFVLVLNNGGAGQVRWVHENLHPGRPHFYPVPYADFFAPPGGPGLRGARPQTPAELVEMGQRFRDRPEPTLCEIVLSRDEHPHRAMSVRRRVAPPRVA
jgi:acetolactate synthase-1/2/3 large subunit